MENYTIKFLTEIYLDLQTIVRKDANEGNLMTAIKTDEIRARLRNKISELSGECCQELQERIEHEATYNAMIL